MKTIHRSFTANIIRGMAALSICLCMVSCATTIPQLQVQYTLPPSSDPLKGRAVCLSIEDQRSDTSILGKGAQAEFTGFTNSVSLSVAEAGQSGSSIGIFQASPLMREVFTRKLERSGLKVLLEKTPGTPSLVIVLKAFSLDLVGRTWRARMTYDARLTAENGAIATQTVNGEAERYELVGREKADPLMSEILTDMVNAMNVPRLFEQAGLSESLR